MSDEPFGRRGARMRGAAAAPTPLTRAQLESNVESLIAKLEAMNEDKIELSTTLAQRETQLKDLSDIAAKYESTQETIARLDQLLLQREAEEEGIIFPDGDRAKWFKGVGDLLKRKDRLVKSIEDVLIDDAITRGLDVDMDRVTVMAMVGREVAAAEDSKESKTPPEADAAPATTPTTARRTLGSSIRQALLGVREVANIASVGEKGTDSVALGAPSGSDDKEPCAAERRRIESLRFRVAELGEKIRFLKTTQKDKEEENVILRNSYVDLREDQTEAYARILALTGKPWKQNPPGGLPGGEQFVRTVGAIDQIQRDREATRAIQEAYAAMSDPEKREHDRRHAEERMRQGDIDVLAKSRERLTKATRAIVQSEETDWVELEEEGEGAGGEVFQAELRLIEAQERAVDLGDQLQRQQRDCEDEKRRMLDDVERNNRDHEEDKNRLREQNRRDHERCEREKRVLRQRIASMVAQIDRLTIAARLYEQQTARLGEATTGAPRLESVHLELERALRENTELRGQIQRLELRVNLLESNASVEDVARYEAMASGVEEMRQLMSCDEVRAELNQSRDLLERSLSTQQSLGQAMRGLMDYVMSVGSPGADGALRPPAAALQAVSRMQSDFQEHERRWAGAERGGTSNAMLRRKLRKTIARATSLRVEEIDDLTAENDALRAQLAENNNIVDLQRWRTVNKEIEIIESEMLENGPHPLTPPRDLLRLARLQTERLQMMPCPELRQFAISLQKEAIPAIHDLPDDYFLRQWNDLYDNVRAWCTTYYSFQEHSTLVDYEAMVHDVQLLGFYVRDVLIHRDYVPQFLNNVNGTLPTGRADVATAIVFRILVEEIFEPVRFMIRLRFTDATQRWKLKKQYKIAFEVRDMSANAYQPRFQSKESFLERKRKQPPMGYPYPEVNEDGPPPKKRVKSSLQKFNFIRTFEDDEPVGTTRDNDGNYPPNMQNIY